VVLAGIPVRSETNNLTDKPLPQSTTLASLKSFYQILQELQAVKVFLVFTLKPLGAW